MTGSDRGRGRHTAALAIDVVTLWRVSLRKLFVSVFAALAAALSFPALAAADDFDLFLEDGRLQLNSGADDEVDVLAPSNDSSTFAGEIDDAGSITTDEVDLTAFRLDDDVEVEIAPIEDLTGSFDEASGELGFDQTFFFVFFRTGPNSGSSGTGCLTGFQGELSTDGSSPDGELEGDPFSDGLIGSGSLIASWQGLEESFNGGDATPEDCDAIDAAYGGPGAVELGFPVGPQLTTTVAPRRNEVKQGGRAATYRLNVRTVDSDESANVKVCGQLRKGLSVVGGNCIRVAGVDADGKTVPVKIKATRKAKPGLYDELALLTDAPGYSGGASRIELKVTKRR